MLVSYMILSCLGNSLKTHKIFMLLILITLNEYNKKFMSVYAYIFVCFTCMNSLRLIQFNYRVFNSHTCPTVAFSPASISLNQSAALSKQTWTHSAIFASPIAQSTARRSSSQPTSPLHPPHYAPGQLSKSNYSKIPISFNGDAPQRYQIAAGEMWSISIDNFCVFPFSFQSR